MIPNATDGNKKENSLNGAQLDPQSWALWR
jgi:hypothetical protein